MNLFGLSVVRPCPFGKGLFYEWLRLFFGNVLRLVLRLDVVGEVFRLELVRLDVVGEVFRLELVRLDVVGELVRFVELYGWYTLGLW
jgi:hypothetical protein